MKLSLVVAQGVHAGKVIPITTAEFVIGRDPACQLRPASPAVSKQHCGISVRDGIVYVRDCGSTNGTFVNGEQVAAERPVQSGYHLKVGPLEFTLKIDDVPVTASSPNLVRPAKAAVLAEGDAVPSSRSPTVVMEPSAKGKDAARSTTTVVEAAGGPADTNTDLDADAAAALLLGGDDGGTVEAFTGDSTTVMETPALGATKPNEPAKDEKKKGHTDSSNAAAELLSKYMRRPRT